MNEYSKYNIFINIIMLESQNQRYHFHDSSYLFKIRSLNTKSKVIGNYQIKQTIGKGTFAKVKLGKHTLTKQLVAIKILDKSELRQKCDMEKVNQQIQILKMVRHKNIIQLYEIIETKKYIFLIMQYCSNGQLFNYILKKEKLTQQQACKFFQQLISGLKYLRSLNIIHRDLKPQNLILDHNFNLKIIDFGLSKIYQPKQLFKTACGSQFYAAPQMLTGNLYDPTALDIWSSGIILFAMLTGYLPFQENNTNQLYRKIMNLNYKIPSFLSLPAKQLISGIITIKQKRMEINEIQQHFFFNYVTYINNTGVNLLEYKLFVDNLIVEQMVNKYGYQRQMIKEGVQNSKRNHVEACYYLIVNKKERQQGYKNLFNINNENFNQNILQKKYIDFQSKVKQNLLNHKMSQTKKNFNIIIDKRKKQFNKSDVYNPSETTQILKEQQKLAFVKQQDSSFIKYQDQIVQFNGELKNSFRIRNKIKIKQKNAIPELKINKINYFIKSKISEPNKKIQNISYDLSSKRMKGDQFNNNNI